MSGWEQRPPSEVQLGNGRLLATFDSVGELEQVFAPHIDALQSRIGGFRTFVLVPSADRGAPRVIALSPDEFEVRMALTHGSQVLRVEYLYRHGPMRLVRTWGMHPTDTLMVDSWEVKDGTAGLLHQSIPWMGNAMSAQCSLFHPSFNGLVHHRGRRWFGVLAKDAIQWVRVGHLSAEDRRRLWDGDRVHAPISDGDLAGFPAGQVRGGWDQVAQGPATWGGLAVGPAARIEFFVICGESESHLGSQLGQVGKIEVSRYLQMIEGMSERRQAPAAEIISKIKNPQVVALVERSIDVLHALQDSTSGALMAAAEVDPHSQLSGGYGYSWPRDGAYLATALGAFGFRERVEHYFQFVRETQDPSGTWWQRYLATGHAGPSWGRIQIDEPASIIRAAYVHFRRTGDLFWLEKYWPTLEKGLSFLESFHSSEHPMGFPSHDLWEERMGIHAYSLSAVASAFGAAARMAGELSNPKLQAHYEKWYDVLSSTIREKFASAEGPIRRSYIVHAWEYENNGHWDECPDVSMLGLIVPFRTLHKDEPAARRIVESVRTRLWSNSVGGIMRYEGDHYRGGNPWILTTLWLAMVELSLENYTEARACFNWVMSKSTDLGMLPEQVHRESGRPFWVIPLGWSHAMYLLFVRDALDRGVMSKIWD